MIRIHNHILIIWTLGISFILHNQNFCSAAKPNSLFSDHMVLQQGVRVPVWGTGRNGEKIDITLAGQTATTMVKNGKWMVALNPLNTGGPYSMSIKGDSLLSIDDIYVGEVWVCSGQSNMGRKMGANPTQKPIFDYENEQKAANYNKIRQYEVPNSMSDFPMDDAWGKWVVCSPSSVNEFSAVGYFFARELYAQYKVPIGLLFPSVGGTLAKFWTSRASLENNPNLLHLVEEYDSAVKNYPAQLEQYQSQLATYREDSAQAKQADTRRHRKPSPPQNPSERRRIACYYNAMIAPLTTFPIKGVLWYQGESDNDFAQEYPILFPALIADWRRSWDIGDFPFLFVQVAPYKETKPEIREAQFISLKKTTNTAMVVTTDCGDANDIHPTNKQAVGYRLALAARALAYHENIEYSGPLFQSYKVENGKVLLSFTHAQNGFMIMADTLRGFTIAGSDNKFVTAKAVINGEFVVVYHDSINTPKSIRYGWANVPDVNLYNKEGLPASPFRIEIK